jgi:type III restriction enzyme
VAGRVPAGAEEEPVPVQGDGRRDAAACPIVWGISATIAHFESAMAEAEATKNRRALPSVIVDAARVQESGLVKDTLVLDIPDEVGNFDSVLVRRGARKLRDATERWTAYSRSQGLLETVRPLLVLQTPNTPDPDDVGVALDTIFAEYPELPASSVRHVLGDHTTRKFGPWEVDWVEPQRVQEEPHVRVLVAKDAISTGWDCPRAEVLVSFRPAKDNTHITQLLGRMVRSALARRIPGDERLNSVDCILPFFDRTTAVKVVRFLTGDLEAMPAGEKKAVIDGRELLPNPNVPDPVWDVWAALPTETLPQRGARPVKRRTMVGLSEVFRLAARDSPAQGNSPVAPEAQTGHAVEQHDQRIGCRPDLICLGAHLQLVGLQVSPRIVLREADVLGHFATVVRGPRAHLAKPWRMTPRRAANARGQTTH